MRPCAISNTRNSTQDTPTSRGRTHDDRDFGRTRFQRSVEDATRWSGSFLLRDLVFPDGLHYGRMRTFKSPGPERLYLLKIRLPYGERQRDKSCRKRRRFRQATIFHSSAAGVPGPAREYRRLLADTSPDIAHLGQCEADRFDGNRQTRRLRVAKRIPNGERSSKRTTDRRTFIPMHARSVRGCHGYRRASDPDNLVCIQLETDGPDADGHDGRRRI